MTSARSSHEPANDSGIEFYGYRHQRVTALLHRALSMTNDERVRLSTEAMRTIETRQDALVAAQVNAEAKTEDEAAALQVAQCYAHIMPTILTQEESLSLVQAAIATAVSAALAPESYDELVAVAEKVFGSPDQW